MKIAHSFTRRASVAGVAALAIVAGGIGLTAANASGTALGVYDEADSPNPGLFVDHGVNKLAFYKGADIGWITTTSLGDVSGLAYTVIGGDSYAPSYQLVTHSDQVNYARLVWEPYQQAGGLDADNGTYTDLEHGVWWTSKIPSGPGSQGDPQPLSFFTNSAPSGAGWTHVTVNAFAIHQGTTTNATSYVTSVTFGGVDVPVTNSDATPFKQSDIDAATSPLSGQIAALTTQKNDLNDDLSEANEQIADLQHQLDVAHDALDVATGPLGTQIHDLTALLTTTQSDFLAYKASHHTADGTSIGESRALLSVTPVHGHKVGVKLSGSIKTAAAVKYQWYLSGKAVAGATKSTYTVPSNAKGKSVSVKVTGTSKNIVFAIHSNTVAAK